MARLPHRVGLRGQQLWGRRVEWVREAERWGDYGYGQGWRGGRRRGRSGKMGAGQDRCYLRAERLEH